MSEELKSLIEQQGKAFDEFKKANDERLDAIEKGQAHSELEATVNKIGADLDKLSAAMDEMEKRANRAAAPAEGEEQKAVQAEHKKAFQKWMRKGDDSGLEALRERKDATFVNVGTPAEGGYAVPIDQDRDIMRLVTDMSPMRQLCRVLSCSTEDYRKMVNLGGTDCGWVGETDPRPNTNTPTFTTISPEFGEVYAYPETTQKALDDLFFDVEAELTYDVAEAFAKAEAVAFLSGAGAASHQPKGLFTATMTTEADKDRDFGKFQYIATGAAAGFAATTPADKLLDMIYATRSHHRQNGKFMLATSTLAEIRKFKDSDNNYIWQPSMQAGQPATIFGYGFVVNEYMPALGANALAVVFGDFKSAYWIFDRIGIRTLRDPYTHKPFVGFYTTKRLGSMIVNTEALKFLKCEA
jgi:HK97 family phage major capsid protein